MMNKLLMVRTYKINRSVLRRHIMICWQNVLLISKFKGHIKTNKILDLNLASKNWLLVQTLFNTILLIKLKQMKRKVIKSTLAIMKMKRISITKKKTHWIHNLNQKAMKYTKTNVLTCLKTLKSHMTKL